MTLSKLTELIRWGWAHDRMAWLSVGSICPTVSGDAVKKGHRPMTEPDNVRVTQADREAYLSVMICPEFDAFDIRAGNWDHTPIIQAFARHREAAEAASKAREAKLREALATIANRINVVGSPWHDAQVALDRLVVETKKDARAALRAKGDA